VEDLGASLRAWRDRLTPAHNGARRRAPGLTRHEVADRAGVSVGYLTRLEQGRATHPSPLVVGALARALELSGDEEQLLFRRAGHQKPERMNRELTPGVRRMLDRLADLPVIVYDAGWEPIAANDLGRALFGQPAGNLARHHFAGRPSRVVRTPAETARIEQEIVADLHAAAARWPADERLHELIRELRTISARFDELSQQRPAAIHASDRKTIAHPELGRITLDCDVMHAHGSDLRIVVFSAAPGTPDALAVERLRVGARPLAAVERLDPLHLV
jgi:transcriptional regulator with XRE-family HTH domain